MAAAEPAFPTLPTRPTLLALPAFPAFNSSPQDVVELQLLREVAARSASFFQAASQLQGLRSVLCDTLDVVRSLRRHMGSLDGDLYSAAVGVAALQRRRGNLTRALDVTKVRGSGLGGWRRVLYVWWSRWVCCGGVSRRRVLLARKAVAGVLLEL